jgi:small subunit ribosomal protein S16
MSAKIKLQRVGTKNQPAYRVVVQDEARPTVANVVAILGTYNPMKEPTEFTVKKELTLDWIRKGAKPTEKVRILLGKAGILPPIDLAALPKRKKKGAEVAAEAPAAQAPAAAAPAAPKEEAPAA